ncbi:MAG TPA: hypothetical protein VLA89_04530 [Gemmatimonadales bacterium]|nr:hypothetical protein [Gemmatimonadales bacterium]
MKVTITIGPARYEFENGDVENVRELIAAVRDELGLTADGTPIVNGAAATADTVLEDGDEVAFNKPAGQKGFRAFIVAALTRI